MKRRKESSKGIAWIMIVLAFSVLVNSFMYAEHKGEKITLNGRWNEQERSLSSTVPVSAYINGDILFIQSLTSRVDINITIVKDGIVFYEQTVPAAQTANIVGIPLAKLERGDYTLELRNQWGGYLYGEFFKE